MVMVMVVVAGLVKHRRSERLSTKRKQQWSVVVLLGVLVVVGMVPSFYSDQVESGGSAGSPSRWQLVVGRNGRRKNGERQLRR